jgi:hypothetical protein
MRALRAAAHRRKGGTVLVLAPTGKAVDPAVREGAGDEGYTIAKAMQLLRDNTLQLDRSTLVIVDEDAGRLARAIIANHDQPITAHEVAAQTPSAALPESVRRIHDRRASTLQRRRATYQSWQADARSFPWAMTTARERHNSRGRAQSLDYGIEM